MSAFKDITGQRFGLLTTKSYRKVTTTGNKKRVFWSCICDCGNTCEMEGSLLRSRSKKPRNIPMSCGCEARKATSYRNSTHRLTGTRVYRSWNSAKQRCLNPNDSNYRNYGGRGISICEHWYSFDNFLNDMGFPPSPNHTIDRIDVNGNYEPSNCRWATPSEQARNRRNTPLYSYNGKTMSLIEWAEYLGIRTITLRKRLEYGWTLDKVFSKHNHKYNSPHELKPISHE